MKLCFLIFFITWIYLLTILKKNKLSAFYFMLGSIGFFSIGFFFFFKPLVKFLSWFILFLMDKISFIFNFYECFIDYRIIFINYKDTAVSLYMNYECCGFIEVLVLCSLVLFYPLFSLKKKILNIIGGFFFTCFANILRLLLICFTVYKFGNEFYYFSHAILGRIIFYILTMVMYYYMFSFAQIKEQKVGKFRYN